MKPAERAALQRAQQYRNEALVRNRAARAKRAAPEVVSRPDGVVRVECSSCGVVEERVAYSALPLILNGCGPKPWHQISITQYDWDRDLA